MLCKFTAGKLLPVSMDDSLAINTFSQGTCQGLSPLVHRVEAKMNGCMDGWMDEEMDGQLAIKFLSLPLWHNFLNLITQESFGVYLCMFLTKTNT